MYIKNLIFIIAFVLLSSINASKIYASELIDININDWFYKDVTELQDKGIINGYTDGTFRPNESITNIEALKMIISASSDFTENNSDEWVSEYMKKGVELGIINIVDTFDPNKLISRSEVAEMICKAMNVDINENARHYFIDTDNLYVEKLHEMNIVNGYLVDGKYCYKPDDNISRAEISKLIVNALNYNADGVQKPFLLTEYAYIENPKNIDELELMIKYLAINNIMEYKLVYDEEIDFDKFVNEATNVFFELYQTCPELFSIYNSVQFLYGENEGKYEIIIQFETDGMNRVQMKKSNIIFYTETRDTVQHMFDTGILNSQMTDKEKADVLYKWVCLNVEYDMDIDNMGSGYSAIHYGKSVCQGYTALYNLMLRFVGIYDVQGIPGAVNTTSELHLWTGAILDDENVLIDTTWGDLGGDMYTEKWFDASEEEFKVNHIWDNEEIYIW